MGQRRPQVRALDMGNDRHLQASGEITYESPINLPMAYPVETPPILGSVVNSTDCT